MNIGICTCMCYSEPHVRYSKRLQRSMFGTGICFIFVILCTQIIIMHTDLYEPLSDRRAVEYTSSRNDGADYPAYLAV